MAACDAPHQVRDDDGTDVEDVDSLTLPRLADRAARHVAVVAAERIAAARTTGEVAGGDDACAKPAAMARTAAASAVAEEEKETARAGEKRELERATTRAGKRAASVETVAAAAAVAKIMAAPRIAGGDDEGGGSGDPDSELPATEVPCAADTDGTPADSAVRLLAEVDRVVSYVTSARGVTRREARVVMMTLLGLVDTQRGVIQCASLRELIYSWSAGVCPARHLVLEGRHDSSDAGSQGTGCEDVPPGDRPVALRITQGPDSAGGAEAQTESAEAQTESSSVLGPATAFLVCPTRSDLIRGVVRGGTVPADATLVTNVLGWKVVAIDVERSVAALADAPKTKSTFWGWEVEIPEDATGGERGGRVNALERVIEGRPDGSVWVIESHLVKRSGGYAASAHAVLADHFARGCFLDPGRLDTCRDECDHLVGVRALEGVVGTAIRRKRDGTLTPREYIGLAALMNGFSNARSNLEQMSGNLNALKVG